MLPIIKETGFGVVTQGAVNRNVKSIKSTRKSSYTKYTSKCRFQVAKYANETGSSAAVRKFKSQFPDLNESTVFGFWKTYLAQMKLAEKRSRSPEKSIVNLQRGRPLLLGNDIDEKVRKYIMTLRYKGGQAAFSIAIAVAKTLIERGDNKSLKVLKFGKDWAQSLFRRMGFKKRAATTGKVVIPEGARKEAELIYLYNIVTKIGTHSFPHQLVFNTDQTPSKYIQSSRYTHGKICK